MIHHDLWTEFIIHTFYRIRRFAEHGFNHYAYERTLPDLVATCLNADIVPLTVQLKVSSHVEESSADVTAINFDHVKEVMYMLLSGIALACIALVMEVIRKNMFTRSRSMQRRPKIKIVKMKRTIRSA